MKVLILDNYDSFTYNLVQYVERILDERISVFRNDALNLEDVAQYDKIILSPGPGIPDEANLLKPIIQEYAPTKSILGVCLGHQAIGEVFGAKLLNTQKVYHGVATEIEVNNEDVLFSALPKKLQAGRYHSWIIDPEGFPEDEFTLTATGPENEIMAIAHKNYDVRGVQFHPESILTPQGYAMLENWIKN